MLRFGPPRSFTCASTCPWIGHLVSGLIDSTIRPIQPRFHYAYDKCLKLALAINSLDRSTKSTPSPDKPAPTPCTHTISDSISLPFRGSFNLSLTVLVHYRSQNIFSLGTWSSRIQSGFLVSRPTRQCAELKTEVLCSARYKYKVCDHLAYQAFTVYGQPFQTVLLASQFFYLMHDGGSSC
jgi:hypothetical protein